MTITDTQRNFISFHVKRFVDGWKWFLQDSNLRATAGKRSATITRAELDDLIARGLMFKGAGAADVHVTETGRQAI